MPGQLRELRLVVKLVVLHPGHQWLMVTPLAVLMLCLCVARPAMLAVSALLLLVSVELQSISSAEGESWMLLVLYPVMGICQNVDGCVLSVDVWLLQRWDCPSGCLLWRLPVVDGEGVEEKVVVVVELKVKV